METAIMGKYREEMVEATRRLVRIKSVKEPPLPDAPFGAGCRDVLAEAVKLGEELGLRVANIEQYAAHIELGDGEEIVGVLAHLDVVPEGGGWELPPYEASIRDGRIYGRGTADNKGPAVAAVYCLKAIRELGIPLKRRVRVILGADEESGSSDMKVYFQREPLPAYGFSPDAAYPIINREKGIMNLLFGANGVALEHPIRMVKGGIVRNSVPDSCAAIIDLRHVADAPAFEKRVKKLGGVIESREDNILTISRKGIPAHGSTPHKGDNAVMRMLDILYPLYAQKQDGASRFLSFLHERIGLETDGASLGVKVVDAPSGPLTLNLGMLSLDENSAFAAADIRFPVTHRMGHILRTAGAAASRYGVSCVADKYTPPLYVRPDTPLVKALGRAYERVTGEKAELLSMGGGTYARALQNNGVAFGPSFPGSESSRIHEANEFIDIDELVRHADVCLQAIIELANI